MLLYLWALKVDASTLSSASTFNDRSVAIGGPRWIPSILDSGELYMSLWLLERASWCSGWISLGLSFVLTLNGPFWFSSSNIRVSCWLSLLQVLTSALDRMEILSLTDFEVQLPVVLDLMDFESDPMLELYLSQMNKWCLVFDIACKVIVDCILRTMANIVVSAPDTKTDVLSIYIASLNL